MKFCKDCESLKRPLNVKCGHKEVQKAPIRDYVNDVTLSPRTSPDARDINTNGYCHLFKEKSCKTN